MTEFEKPLVSIITPSFNQGQFIEDTILSILGQTYKNIQYIIMDGGSTDSTMEIVNKYRDKINIIIHEKDEGQADAINKGFKLATGEVVGWVNSDDVLYPECVERIIELYKNNPSGAVYYHSVLDWIDENNKFLNQSVTKIPNRNHLLNICYDVIQPGSFYPKKLIENIGFLDKSIFYCMDLDLFLRLSVHGEFHYTTEKPYSAFRIYPGTKTDTGKLKFLNDIKNVLVKNGAKLYSRNIFIAYYYGFKQIIKSFIYG